MGKMQEVKSIHVAQLVWRTVSGVKVVEVKFTLMSLATGGNLTMTGGGNSFLIPEAMKYMSSQLGNSSTYT